MSWKLDGIFTQTLSFKCAVQAALWHCYGKQNVLYDTNFLSFQQRICINLFLLTLLSALLNSSICDWILENQPNCHTRSIPFYWPSYRLHLYTTLTLYPYRAWLTGLLFQSEFCQPWKFMTETMEPMEGMGVKFTTTIGRCVLTPFKHVWAYGWHFWNPQLVQTVLTPPTTLPPTTHPPPIMCHQ